MDSQINDNSKIYLHQYAKIHPEDAPLVIEALEQCDAVVFETLFLRPFVIHDA